MHDLLLHTLTVFMGFFAIMNPIANAPIFIGLTEGDDSKTTRQVAIRALLIAFAIVSLFSLAGNMIFELFGIGLPAFRITGGLLVFMIGFQMLQGSHSNVHHPQQGESGDGHQTALSVAVSPLAIPILAGPGTIATAMNFSAASVQEMLVTITAFAALCVVSFICFVSGRRLVSFLGASAMGAITRMMGLILAVIGTQMLIEGIKGAFNLAG